MVQKGQLSGFTATIVLANGRTLSANLSGSYSSHTGLSTVQINGTGDARGVSLRLQFTPSSVESLSGTLMGQTIKP